MSAAPSLSQPLIVDIPVPQDHTYFQSPEDYKRLQLLRTIPEIIRSLEQEWKMQQRHKEDKDPIVIQYWLEEVEFPESVREVLLRMDGMRFEMIQKKLFKNYQDEQQAKIERQAQELRDQEYARSFRCQTIGRIAAYIGCNQPKCTYRNICAASLLIGIYFSSGIWNCIKDKC